MNRWQSAVEAFHRAMAGPSGDQHVGEYPHVRNPALRARLIAEETAETIAALGFDVEIVVTETTHPGVAADDRLISTIGTGETIGLYQRAADPSLVEVADGIADAIYVLLGTAIEAGVDMDPVFDEVHRSNMAKAGGPRRADGKVLKPAGWTPPDIAGVLARQAIEAAHALGVPFHPTEGGVRIDFPAVGGCDFGCCPAEEEAAS